MRKCATGSEVMNITVSTVLCAFHVVLACLYNMMQWRVKQHYTFNYALNVHVCASRNEKL